MHENLLLSARALSLFLLDWSIAFACGLLLSSHWLRQCCAQTPSGQQQPPLRVPRMRWTAILLVGALFFLLYFETATMIDQLNLVTVLRSIPEIASTHTGSVISWMLLTAVVLLAGDYPVLHRGPPRAARALTAILIAVMLSIHAALGHAADDGAFSRAEILQFVHLASMAIWAGGVLTSGMFIVPKLAALATPMQDGYLSALSRSSMFSATVALASGVVKGLTGLDGHLASLRSDWGYILLLKLFFVCIALALGLMHRRWIHNKSVRSADRHRTLQMTLRVEGASLTIVILLSAFLANVESPS